MVGCSDGFYGMDCKYECGEGCDNRKCDIRDGNCTSGCKSLYDGPKCDQKSYVNLMNFVQQYKT